MVFAVVVVTVFATAFVVLVVVGGFVTVFVFVFIEAAVAAVEEIYFVLTSFLNSKINLATQYRDQTPD